MKRNVTLPLIQSIISKSGVVVMNKPTLDHPIPVPVFCRYKPDGTVASLWPKGNIQAGLSTFRDGAREQIMPQVHKLFFALGIDNLLAQGKFILYADLPTATYLQRQWSGAWFN
jgi:hypothetical protein